MSNDFDLLKSPLSTNVENREKTKIELRFFLAFIAAVTVLQKELWDAFTPLDYIPEVEPGMHTTVCQRAWMIGGLKVEDEVRIVLDNLIYINGISGHEHDFSTLIVWGVYENKRPELNNPKIGSYWQTEMKIWKAPEGYHLGNSRPIGE